MFGVYRFAMTSKMNNILFYVINSWINVTCHYIFASSIFEGSVIWCSMTKMLFNILSIIWFIMMHYALEYAWYTIQQL